MNPKCQVNLGDITNYKVSFYDLCSVLMKYFFDTKFVRDKVEGAVNLEVFNCIRKK
jgi:hypothetical protein